MYRNLELEDLTIDGEKEVWVRLNEIDGFENIRDWYYVSSFGRIKSVGGRKDKILKQVEQHGYLLVRLQTLDNKPKTMRVNRLVAFAFVGGYSDGLVCNHLDEQKKNNHYLNLEWCTQKQNVNYGSAIKRRAEKQSMPVIGECVKTGEVIEFPSIAEAGRNGFYQQSVSSCCNGKSKTHKGYRWRFKESA